MPPSVLVAIAAAGSLGALLRFCLVQAMLGRWPGQPWATAAVNLVGCLGFGLCWALAQGRWSPAVTAGVLVGFFGAFTTFSSFAFDCQQLLVERRYLTMAANVLAQNGVGLLAMVVGIVVGERWRG